MKVKGIVLPNTVTDSEGDTTGASLKFDRLYFSIPFCIRMLKYKARLR